MLPELNRIRKTGSYISMFRGLNRTPNAGFSRVSSKNSAMYTEFSDMKNLCGDDFPRLRTRKTRSRVTGLNVKSNLLASGNELIFVTETGDSGVLKVGTEEYAITGYQSGDHRLTLYGNHVIVLPEKLFFNLSGHTFEAIEFNYSSSGEELSTTEINVALMNVNKTKKFRDFSIEKVALNDSGEPLTVNYIYEKASGLESPEKQTYPSNQYDAEDVVEDWQLEYYLHWGNIKVSQTVEAQGENPSGVYKCYDITKKDVGAEPTKTGVRSFVKIENYYVRIFRNDGSGTNIFAGLKKGDFVKISGMVHSVVSPLAISVSDNWANNDWGNYIDVLNNNTFKIYYADSNSIVIKAIIDKSVPYNGPMKISRVMPQIDSGMMLEVNNRLWACSSASNEIYSSKQGDCRNWQAYGDGISTDSYAATVGNEGVFTGIARQNDSVIFFKENWIIKMFGTKPSNFSLASYNVPGVERGSEKSVVWVNGVLFYLSPIGVCHYSPGGQPVVISDKAFGNKKYKNGIAGRHRNKYFLSAQTDSGTWELLVFDTSTGLWHKEDNTRFSDCMTYNNVLYWIDADTEALVCADQDNNLLDSAEKEGEFDWCFETPDMYDNDFGKKYVSKLQISVKMSPISEAVIYAQFRHGSIWHELKRVFYTERRNELIHVPVRRADFLRLRVEGRGEIEVSGIQIDYARGSEKPWQF